MSNTPEAATQSTPEIRVVNLSQVYPPDNETETDVDIIAIHGLDTKSPETWTWVDPQHPGQPGVNWLQAPNMLPNKAPRARIFTCDWPSDMYETSNLAQKTFEELARCLLAGIKRRPLVANTRGGREGRPIIFIASCLGGIILMKALVEAGHHSPLRKDTRGIVFLSTPFRGTSFQDVAKWVEPGLAMYAWFQDRKVTTLLDNVKEATSALHGLVCSFTQLCRDYHYQVFTFYEKGYTNLYGKVFPWMPNQLLPKPKLLVDESSANLDIVPRPLPLNRSHVMMNKFQGPHDPDYQEVVQKIEEFLGKIREGTALQRADAWIREKHYTADRLRIERLSRETLPMEQCYINLLIVEQSRRYARGPVEKSAQGSEAIGASQSSPFSLHARLNIETPVEWLQGTLQTIFNLRRRGQDGHMTRPRRIWIQGRAGVGKTTLCKKMVHEFMHRNMWRESFDRVLWIPLRNLKQRVGRGRYGLAELFADEYFPWHEKQSDLAHALQAVCNEPDGGRSLFVLDGLDEILHDLSPDSDMYRFINHLLCQTNVIVTSRPSVTPRMNLYDLVLETVGFYPDQVFKYIQTVEPANARDIEDFLKIRPLLRDLVRIPIQLDAVCYAWKDVYASAPETMTDLYMAVERGLAQKDVSRLGKRIGNRSTHQNDTLCPTEVENLTKDETDLIAGLAFTGLCNDVIVFDAKCRDSVSRHFAHGEAKINDTLRRLSYLRPSDPSVSEHHRTYHFLHLTLQEYFAARYFCKKWAAGERVKCLNLRNGKVDEKDPAAFLQERKYTRRYDIFWRFAAGLLDAALSDEGKQLARFFSTIQEEPVDLLGPAHQRLIMRCLNEVRQSHPFAARRELERHLSKWLVLQCNMTKVWKKVLGPLTLASELEFPEQAIVNVMKEEDDEVKWTALWSMEGGHPFPLQVAEAALLCLRVDSPYSLTNIVLSRVVRVKERLSDEALNAIAVKLENQCLLDRRDALHALDGQPGLPERILKQIAVLLDDDYFSKHAFDILSRQWRQSEGLPNQIAARLRDEIAREEQASADVFRRYSKKLEGCATLLRAQLNDSELHRKRVDALRSQSNLQEISARLQDQDPYARMVAIEALSQRDLPREILNQIAVRLQDQNKIVRLKAINALQSALHRQSNIPRDILHQVTGRLDDQDPKVQRATIHILRHQPNLPGEIVDQIVRRLGHKDSYVRDAAMEALQGQSDLQHIADRLQDQDPYIRKIYMNALQNSNLSRNILRQIAGRLDDQCPEVRRATIHVLQGQSALSEGILNQLAGRLDDQYPDVRRDTIDVLKAQANLPVAILNDIAVRLKDQDPGVRGAAIGALRMQTKNLPERFLHQISERLQDQDSRVRRVAGHALGGQLNLPERILHQIAERLHDQDPEVREAAIGALRMQIKNLPKKILHQISEQLQDQDSRVRRAAGDALGGQLNLPERILHQIAERLHDQDSRVRGWAGRTLVGQLNLPERILNQIALRLQDRRFIDNDSLKLMSTLIQRHEFHANGLLGDHAEGLFLLLLLLSFRTHIAWYIKDGKSYLETNNHVEKVELLHQRAGLELAIRRAQKEAGIPAVAVEHGFE